MKFMILNREQIEYISPEEPHIIISMVDPNYEPPEIKGLKEGSEHLIGICNLRFSDDDDIDTMEDSILMSDKQAEKISTLVNKFKDDVELIICQCDLGISRSPAVALALSEMLNGPSADNTMFFDPPFMPNEYVYNMILQNWRE